jgi:hypothetical protein
MKGRIMSKRRFTDEEYKYGRLFRTIAYPHYEIEDPWDKMEQYAKDNWAEIYKFKLCNDSDRHHMENVHLIAKKERDFAVNTTEKIEKSENELKKNQYSFVAAKSDIDYDRILREAPKGTLFLLVERRTRTDQADDWSLFVHNTVLTDERVEGVLLGHKDTHRSLTGISSNWGYSKIGDTELHSYRVIGAKGSVPGYVRKNIDHIKRALNPKDTKTVVTIF